MGGDKVWMAGLRVIRINYEEDILYLMGQAIPGEPVGGFIGCGTSVILIGWGGLD